MNFSLKNENNYKTELSNTSISIFKNYQEIVLEYFEKYNIFFIDENYNKYIKIKGLLGISNIFKLLLLYTKNLEVTNYHTKNAVIFYLGFIEQISNTSNNYLNLNIKDAIMFIYKKTIFDIVKNKEVTNCKKMKNINKLIHIFNYGLTYIIDKDLDYKKANCYMNYICNCKKNTNEEVLYNYLNLIEIFKSILNNKCDKIVILNTFIKKLIAKKSIDYNKIENNIILYKNNTNNINLKNIFS